MKTIQKGELSVSNAGEVEIELKKRPRKVEAKFIDDPKLPTCSAPTDKDTVECSLVERGFMRKTYYICIQWSVAGSREVFWEAFER